MRIRVDGDRCMGHGMCASLAPEVYHVSDLGINEMGEFDVPAGLDNAALRGSLACPERIITVLRDSP
jgi:ferredoxin